MEHSHNANSSPKWEWKCETFTLCSFAFYMTHNYRFSLYDEHETEIALIYMVNKNIDI